MGKDRILLIDFSKVVSPIWISKHLAENLSEFLTLSKEEIRSMYKQHIWGLVKWEYPISVFIDEVVQYLKAGYSEADLLKACKEVPTLDMDFLEWLQTLRERYFIDLVSDIHEVLGEAVRKELGQYFDGFIFSFEEKSKKSEDIFWQNLSKKIDFPKVELFVDDKEENIKLAEKYGIPWFVYDASKWVQSIISKLSSN